MSVRADFPRGDDWREVGDDGSRVRQLRSLVVLFALYAVVLLFVILFVTDGGHIGSILAGISGHALYATTKTAFAWREASWLDAIRGRMLRRLV